MRRLIPLVLALALAACAGTPPADVVLVSPALPRPVIADECWRDNPAEPALAGGRTRDVVRHIEERKADRRRLAGWRVTCRASLKATFGAPPKRAQPIS